MTHTPELQRPAFALRFADDTTAVVVEEDAPERRYTITGMLLVETTGKLDRPRVLAAGRVGQRVVVVEDTSVDVEFMHEGRVPFRVGLRTRLALDAIELCATSMSYLPLGAGRVAAADIPPANDLERWPVAVAIGGGQVALQKRVDASDVNLDVFGAVPIAMVGLNRVGVEIACLDADEQPLFRDESSCDAGYGEPVLFRVNCWPKHGAWRGTASVFVRVRAEVRSQTGPLLIPAEAFLTAGATRA